MGSVVKVHKAWVIEALARFAGRHVMYTMYIAYSHRVDQIKLQ